MNDFSLPAASGKKRQPAASLEKEALPTPVVEETEVSTEEKSKYDKDELLAIFDEIIFSGEYTEDVVIKERLKVAFRTRTTGEIEDITRLVDNTQANLVATLNEKRTILNLQYALTHYQGRDLKSLKVEDRAKFLKGLPAPVIGALIGALVKFDDKVFEACREGEENF